MAHTDEGTGFSPPSQLRFTRGDISCGREHHRQAWSPSGCWSLSHPAPRWEMGHLPSGLHSHVMTVSFSWLRSQRRADAPLNEGGSRLLGLLVSKQW